MAIRSTLLVLLVMLASTSAHADPIGESRVGLIDTAELWAPNGIARWATARAKLDAERPRFVAVEVVPGTPKPIPKLDVAGKEAEDFNRKLDGYNRQAIQNHAWAAHEHDVLDPIEADIHRALEKFAQAHGIGILLDRSKLGDTLLAVGSGADLTSTFIKEYNASNSQPPPTSPAKKPK